MLVLFLHTLHSSYVGGDLADSINNTNYCKKCGVTEHPRGAIFSCFRGNSMGYNGNMKILLPWGILIHRILKILMWCTYLTEHPRGAIFSCFRYNSMGYHGNMKILLPWAWGIPIHSIFYSVTSILLILTGSWEYYYSYFIIQPAWAPPGLIRQEIALRIL